MKINEQRFQEFKLTLPEEIRDEVFCWLHSYYSVSKALFIIKEQNLEAGNLNVADWCKSLGMDGQRNDNAIHLLNGVQDKDVIQEHIKPKEYPVIIVQHTWGRGKKKDSSTLVIDGNKRLRRAFLDGIETVKGYFLPEHLAKLVKEA